MFSFAAITANNGWAQALTGGLIVMTGLSVLSFVISQLHKLVDFIERSGTRQKIDQSPDIPQEIQPKPLDRGILEDLAMAAQTYQPLTRELGDTFALSALYKLLQEKNLPHPHLTLRALREAGYLTPKGEGQFSWSVDG